MNIHNTGIYRIEIGGYFYIGQSTTLSKRKTNHLYNLRKGTHCNPMMQSVYDKYQNFSFKVMLNCDVDQLDMLEQSALDICYGDEDCMNLAKDVKSPGRGRIVTTKTRKLLSNANQGHNNPNCSSIVYSFIHKDGNVETCTMYELRSKYNLDRGHLSKVVRGKRKSHKGWKIN